MSRPFYGENPNTIPYVIAFNQAKQKIALLELHKNELRKAEKDIEVALTLLELGNTKKAKAVLRKARADLEKNNNSLPEAS